MAWNNYLTTHHRIAYWPEERKWKEIKAGQPIALDSNGYVQLVGSIHLEPNEWRIIDSEGNEVFRSNPNA